jgi:AcrR family transcriptional regulator
MTILHVRSNERRWSVAEQAQLERRRAVLDAAAQVLAEKAYAAATLAEIGERAGVQAGSLYYYFASKEELVEEVLSRGVRQSRDAVEASLNKFSPSSTPEERLVAATERMMLAALENTDYTAAHLRCAGQIPSSTMPNLFAEVRAMNQLWLNLLVKVTVSADDVDMNPTTVRLLIIGAISWTVEWPEYARQPAPEIARTLSNLVLRGPHAPSGQPLDHDIPTGSYERIAGPASLALMCRAPAVTSMRRASNG